RDPGGDPLVDLDLVDLVAGLPVVDPVDADGFVVAVDAEADSALQQPADGVRHGERVDQHGACAHDLPADQVDATTVEQPVDAVRCLGRGQESDGDGADEAAHQVHTHDVQRVVVAQP